MTFLPLGGGHPFLQHDEGQSDGVPGQVCQQQESGEGGRHQGVLWWDEEKQEDENWGTSFQLQIVNESYDVQICKF